MNCAIATDIGFWREENQDIVRAEKFGADVLAVVCDGMGGENNGLEASEKTIGVFFEHFNKNFTDSKDEYTIRQLLMSCASAANSTVYYTSRLDINKRGMGTTLVAAYVTEDKYYVINAGDSRAYYCEKNKLYLLTEDHTFATRLYKEGRISLEQLENYPQKHYLTKAIGINQTIECDFISGYINDGASLLLCSDGLSSFCSGEEMLNIISNKDLNTESKVKKLMRLGLDSGGKDNISVAVIEH